MSSKETIGRREARQLRERLNADGLFRVTRRHASVVYLLSERVRTIPPAAEARPLPQALEEEEPRIVVVW